MDIVAYKVIVATREFLALLGRLAIQVKVGTLVLKDYQDIPVYLVPQDTPASEAYQVIQELTEKDFQDIQELVVILEMRGCPDTQVIMDTLALKVNQAILDLPDYLVIQDCLVTQELMELLDTRGLWERRATQGSKEYLVILESKGSKERVVTREFLDILEDQDIQDRRE